MRIKQICPVLALWIASALMPLTASGHATLQRSIPADGGRLPDGVNEVRLWYSEEVSAAFSSARLLDVGGESAGEVTISAIPGEPAQLRVMLPELPSGVYSLLWKALSEADGHYSRGLFVFGVGAEAQGARAAGVLDNTPAALDVALRWANYLLLVALTGTFVVIRFVLTPGTDHGAGAGNLHRRAKRRAWRAAQWCAFAGVAMGLAALLRQAALTETASASTTWRIMTDSRWGQLWLIREVLWLSLTLIIVRLRHDTGRLRLQAVTASSVVVGIALVNAATGHAAAVAENTSAAVVLDALHLLAAGVWVGGLLALAMALLPLLRHDPGFGSTLRTAWRPFSRMAAFSVAVLLVTGLYNLGQQVASADALFGTEYGQVLLFKLGLFLATGAFGFVSALLIHPRLAAPLVALSTRDVALHGMPALVRCEIGLALLVLLATAFITAAPAPRDAAFTLAPEDFPAELSKSVGDMLVTLSIKPNRPGQNVLTVFAASTRRPPPAEIMRVILRFTSLDQDMGRISAVAKTVESGRYVLGGNFLSLVGRWQIDVVVRRRGLEDTVARFEWSVPPAGLKPAVWSKAPLEAPLTTLSALLGLALLLVVLTWRIRCANPLYMPGRQRNDMEKSA